MTSPVQRATFIEGICLIVWTSEAYRISQIIQHDDVYSVLDYVYVYGTVKLVERDIRATTRFGTNWSFCVMCDAMRASLPPHFSFQI
jgi:hypothetical protein